MDLVRTHQLWGARRSVDKDCYKWQDVDTIRTKKRGSSPRSKALVTGVNNLTCNATKMAADWIFWHRDSIRECFGGKHYRNGYNLFRHVNAPVFERCTTEFEDAGFDKVDGIIRYNYDDLHFMVEYVVDGLGLPMFRCQLSGYKIEMQHGSWDDLYVPVPVGSSSPSARFWVYGTTDWLYRGRVLGSRIISMGDVVRLTPIAYSGYKFAGWRLDSVLTKCEPNLTNDGSNLMVTADAQTFIWADFAPI